MTFVCGLAEGCYRQSERVRQMEPKDLLQAVSNDRVEFATMRPPDSKFVTLERRVVVTAPPELVRLAETGEVTTVEALVELLKEPDRAWAAVVLLAAMTRREEKVVDAFAAHPDQWWASVGKTAYERWANWLKEAKAKLVWDAKDKVFVERE